MIPVIDPKWRTSTVVELCQSMRETGDYSALPILADALQDADCNDFSFLTELRANAMSTTDAERTVAVVMSDETAKAVEWLDAFAAELGDNYEYTYDENDNEIVGGIRQPMNYAILVSVANGYIESGETLTQYGGQNWQSVMHRKKDEFWDKFQLVTGRTYSREKNKWGYKPHGSFFSCSC